MCNFIFGNLVYFFLEPVGCDYQRILVISLVPKGKKPVLNSVKYSSKFPYFPIQFLEQFGIIQ